MYSQPIPTPEQASNSIDSIPTDIQLGEIVVSSRRPDALVTSDKISYSPDATLSGSGGTAFDAVSSLPGVAIDSRGSISVNGMKGITINIDGRKSLLTGETLMTYLKSLDAGRVERIEILSAPSAKNEASSTPLTLNLRLKRPREQGFTVGTNGSARLGNAHRPAGQYPAHTATHDSRYRSHTLSLRPATPPSYSPTVLIFAGRPDSSRPITADGKTAYTMLQECLTTLSPTAGNSAHQ